MKANAKIIAGLTEACRSGLIVEKPENNQYLAYSYRGAGTLITPKWNVKIYNTMSLVCNDMGTLDQLISGSIQAPDTSLKLLQIDDAGWGSPLCGVLVGITDGKDMYTREVDVSYFQEPKWSRKTYLSEYASQGWYLLKVLFKADPKTHRIEICTGHINTRFKDALRERGYSVVVTDIQGLLQDRLEKEYRRYVREHCMGVDLAYDPKEVGKDKIPVLYAKAVAWGRKNAPHLLKTGWKNL